MINISIDSREMSRFLKDVNNYSETKQAQFKHEVYRATYAIQYSAKNNSPVDKGFLKNSIDAVIKSNQLTGQVIVKRHYGIYVHEGTKPHIIRPRFKKVLAWRGKTVTGKRGKNYTFAKFVNHPGTKANPFLEKAVNRERPIFQSNMIKILSRVK